MLKKIKKKSYLPLISFLSLVMPSIIAISCESQSRNSFYSRLIDDVDFYSKRYYRPFQFNEIKKFGKGQPIMSNGLGFDAYSHGLSFIWNVMRKLEFNISQDEGKVLDNGETFGIKYYDKWNHNEKKNKWESERKFNQSDFENNQESELYQENPEKILRIFEKLKVFLKWNVKLLGSGQYWRGEPLGVDGEVGNYAIKRSGHHSIKLYWNVKVEGNNAKKIFNVDKFTAWGNKKKRNEIVGDIKKILKGQKSLTYAMPRYFSIIDGFKEKPKEAKIEEGNKVILVTEVRNYHDSIKDYKLTLVSGSKLKKQIARNKKWSFNSIFTSNENFLQGFQIIKNQVKIEEIKMLITAAIKNMHYFLNKNDNKRLKDIVHPVLKKMFDFIKNLKINEEEILKRIHQAIEELNNGSHNMFAVEIFARGVENVPLRYMPDGIDGYGVRDGLKMLANNNKLGKLTGVANTLDMRDIIKWAHTTKKGYKDENGNKSQNNREGFDPDKGNWFIGDENDKTKNIKRLGKEIVPMGGIVEREKYQNWAIRYNNWVTAISENPENEITEPKFDSYWSKNKKYLF